MTGSKASTVGKYNPIRYRGYVYDTETQLYYLNTRYYNPDMCRFISPDAISYLEPDTINGLNLYAYCKNNPISYSDPTGHFLLVSFIIGATIGFVIGGAFGAVSAAANNQSVIGGFLIGGVVGGITGGFAAGCANAVVAMAWAFVAGAGGDMATQFFLEEKSFQEINLISSLSAGIGNALLAWAGKGLILEVGTLPVIDDVIFSSITSGPSLALGMTINMGIAEYTPTYTIGELFDDVAEFFKKPEKGR